MDKVMRRSSFGGLPILLFYVIIGNSIILTAAFALQSSPDLGELGIPEQFYRGVHRLYQAAKP